MEKINGKVILVFCFWLLVIGLLVYSRFVNLGWGLPYPMHPDERNMATAVQQLNCQLPEVTINLPASLSGQWEEITNWVKIGHFDLFNCFNPRFFAYGQFPLYLSYLIAYVYKFFDGGVGFPISFEEVTISLRIISAVASLINTFILIKIIDLLLKKKSHQLLSTLIIIFSPFFIQFAHFGTTESLLMMLYSAIIYFSLLFVDKKIHILSLVVSSSLLIGLSMATKVSSLLFLIVPFSILLFNVENLKQKTSVLMSKSSLFFYGYRLIGKVIDLIILVFLSFVIFFIFAPHNLINFTDFISSINYESNVALGQSQVFYTRQFSDTVPVLFQLVKVFPYTLGLPLAILGGLGILWLGWKDKRINLLRFAFFVYFIPSAIIYAKWSRFMAPILPLVLIFAILAILNIKNQILKIHIKNQKFYVLICYFAFCILIFTTIIPGVTYLSIYQNPDVRVLATEWIDKNIPANSYVLSETANVVDIPLDNKNNLNVISFNFYDLDESPQLQQELENSLEKADYIFVPSRRIFANHSKQNYPLLSKYYEDLFSGKLGFVKIAEFSAGLNDEEAEETWTVFDHPVIRIYKKK